LRHQDSPTFPNKQLTKSIISINSRFVKDDKRSLELIPIERIQSSILLIRGQKVMLDRDLAELYEVQTRTLIQAMKRNYERFPSDFMFQLTPDEYVNLRSQIVISRSWGGRRYPPYAFTEHGALMLASVLNSPRAVEARKFEQFRSCALRVASQK
jgi:hypothetical protein